MPESALASAGDEAAFHADGRLLAADLGFELGKTYVVQYCG